MLQSGCLTMKAADKPRAGFWSGRVSIGLKKALIPLYHVLIPGAAVLAAAMPLYVSDGLLLKAVSTFFMPAIFAFAYVTVAGVLSMPHQRSIVSGVFPRSLDHPIYIDRRIYGLCLTAVYYFGPVYAAVLYVPPFRKYFFRLFGYTGDLDFTIHPDTWIRDLPLVRFGKGAYVANQATIGTNITLFGNDILVDRVEIGDGSLVGALAAVGPGAVIGRRVEIGVRAALGLRVSIGDDAKVGADCAIGHEAVIGERAIIGAKCVVNSGARLPPDATLPPEARFSGGAQR
jgi:carbonic anhydrase/acetyltransferase-like protein (isoleucine patch superfamily)